MARTEASISTAADDRCLAFIRNFMDTMGYPPTVRQIGEHLGVRSPSTIHARLKRLQREGRLVATRNRQHTLKLEVVENA